MRLAMAIWLALALQVEASIDAEGSELIDEAIEVRIRRGAVRTWKISRRSRSSMSLMAWRMAPWTSRNLR